MSADAEDPERVVTGDGTVLTVGERLGGGAEGTVYRVDAERAVKIYKPANRTERRAEKIAAMLATRPTEPLGDRDGAAEGGTYVWPTTRVFAPEGAAFVGYLMAYLDLGGRREAQKHAREVLDWRRSTERERTRSAHSLAAAVAGVHERGHALGDMNHENVYFGPDGRVTLVDCDAFHISGGDGQVFHGRTEHPRYAPPEGIGRELAAVERADRFGLAVHLFQLLMAGFHPFQGAGPRSTGGSLAAQIAAHRFPYRRPDRGVAPPPAAPPYRELPAGVRSLFERAFVAGKAEPTERPTAADWMERLGKTLARGAGADGRERPAAEPSLDIESELAAIRELLPELSREAFFRSEGGVGFEFTLPPVECPVDRFRLMVEYTPEYPAVAPDVWVIEPEIDPETASVAETDRHGNARIDPPAEFTWHADTDTGATAVEMAARWIRAYCRSLAGDS